jgi:hypothetical protein
VRIYLAARYSRRLELLGYAAELTARGHEVVSSWIDGHHETEPGIDASAPTEQRAGWAAEDLADCLRADCIISFTEPPRGDSRGGRHTEFGIGLARGTGQVLIGPREHVFHCLPEVIVFPDWSAFVGWLDADPPPPAGGWGTGRRPVVPSGLDTPVF